MFCQLYQDSLTEYTYAAELAGLGYSIQNSVYGLTVSGLSVAVITVSSIKTVSLSTRTPLSWPDWDTAFRTLSMDSPLVACLSLSLLSALSRQSH